MNAGPLKTLDKALWDLPLWARKVVVFPFACWFAVQEFVLEGAGHAWPAGCNAWRFAMDHVNERPEF